MSVLLVFLLLVAKWSRCEDSEDICRVCDCLPFGDKPLQAFCVDKGFTDKEFWPITTLATSLQLVYVSSMKSVNFDQKSFDTDRPLDLLLQNCSDVQISDDSINQLRSLVIRDVKVVKVGVLDSSELWSVILENIEELTIDNANFNANYSVKIGNIGSLTISTSREETACENSGLRFTLFDSVINPVSSRGLMICGDHIKVEGNTFKSVSELGFQITAESDIKITDNRFQNLGKKAFNLTSPEIYISGNDFETLPAGALSEVSTLQDTFFTNNSIHDVDLGGVLLDMSWGMTLEQNTIDCDCASKRTSILNPKEGMLYLTNTSHETLQNIFQNNFCRLNCSVTLKTFSYALIQGDVCLTNDTRLEEEKLCDITVVPEYDSDSDTDAGHSLVSAASRTEFLVPLSIIVVTVLITSSVCYGFKEMKTFKFVFEPRGSTPKLPTE